jgi:polygalacturonase
MNRMNRRELLKMSGLLAAGSIGPLSASAKEAVSAGSLRLFNPRDHGAHGDGTTLDTTPLNEAIDACHQAGGGVAYVPPGIYLCGTVVLKSNVTLYLEAGATLLGSSKLSDYVSQRGLGEKSDTNGKHLIFARDAENIGLAGPGRIDGQGPKFWVPSGRVPPPPEDGWRDVATYDWKPLPRPSPLLEFYNCRNVRIEDVRIENAPSWTLRPIQCNNVFIRGIQIKNPVIGPNTDGLDLTCSQNVFVSDCLIDTGDDAICLKSENPYSDEIPVSKNITITNCVLTSCCNGLKFGTSTRGGFENITFSNCVLYNEDVRPAARMIAGIAVEMVDGGWVEGVVISNVRMQRVRTPIFIRRGARRNRPDGTPGTLRGVMIDNLHATNSILTSSITGLPTFEAEEVSLSNIRIDSDEAGKEEWVKFDVSESEQKYPEARMFGRLPAAGLYCRHVRGLSARNVKFKFSSKEERPAMVFDDVRDAVIEGLRTSPVMGKQPVIKLIQSKEVVVRDCTAPPSTAPYPYLDIEGDQTEHVVVMGNDFMFAKRATRQSPDVPEGAVSLAGNVHKVLR